VGCFDPSALPKAVGLLDLTQINELLAIHGEELIYYLSAFATELTLVAGRAVRLPLLATFVALTFAARLSLLLFLAIQSLTKLSLGLFGGVERRVFFRTHFESPSSC
jgi:hypothetical protein